MSESRAEEFRRHAERVLAEAENTKDPATKAILLDIAARYDWLAKWSERQARGEQ